MVVIVYVIRSVVVIRATASDATVRPRRSTKSSSVTPRTARLNVTVSVVTGRAVVAATTRNVAFKGGSGAGAGGSTGGKPADATGDTTPGANE